MKPSKILAMLACLLVPACVKQRVVDPPEGGGSRVELQLESLYLGAPASLVDERLPARTVSLSLSGESENALAGTLMLDPNTCTIDDFGDRGICTLIATQGIEVTLARRTITDPTGQGRRITRHERREQLGIGRLELRMDRL